jgi:hypothetical protein
MEPEVLLSYSQEPTTDPYLEPDESIPHTSIILSLFSHLHLGLPNGLNWIPIPEILGFRTLSIVLIFVTLSLYLNSINSLGQAGHGM